MFQLLIGCQGFCSCHSDWLIFRYFPGYQLKIKIILILTKRRNQALIQISTILKFSAPVICFYFKIQFITIFWLRNLGNTCYMNSILQCVSHTLPLSQYFESGRYQEDVNKYSETRGLVSTFSFQKTGVFIIFWKASNNPLPHIDFFS